jgi:hypothetical protein
MVYDYNDNKNVCMGKWFMSIIRNKNVCIKDNIYYKFNDYNTRKERRENLPIIIFNV